MNVATLKINRKKSVTFQNETDGFNDQFLRGLPRRDLWNAEQLSEPERTALPAAAAGGWNGPGPLCRRSALRGAQRGVEGPERYGCARGPVRGVGFTCGSPAGKRGRKQRYGRERIVS